VDVGALMSLVRENNGVISIGDTREDVTSASHARPDAVLSHLILLRLEKSLISNQGVIELLQLKRKWKDLLKTGAWMKKLREFLKDELTSSAVFDSSLWSRSPGDFMWLFDGLLFSVDPNTFPEAHKSSAYKSVKRNIHTFGTL